MNEVEQLDFVSPTWTSVQTSGPAPEVVPDGQIDLSPLLTRPKKVAIVAMGLSCTTFVQEMMSTQNMKNPFDEVWAINRGLRGLPHDKLFLMDDLRWLETKDKAYADVVKRHNKPVITSTAYADYPMSIPYPLHEVLENIRDDVLTHNTVSYALAYAIAIGVQDVFIYGADFIYPNGSTAEVGGQAVAYLLGIAYARGINPHIPQASTLLYSNTVKVVNGQMRRDYYGYHRKEEMAQRKNREARNGA